AYKDLWSIIATQYPERNFLITGSPGTGKTFFIVFLLYLLVGMGKTVVFQKSPDKVTCYKFSNGTVESAPIRSMCIVLDNPQVYYLLDTMEPQLTCNARKIVVSSPNRKRYKEYEKGRSVDTRIMPTWDLEELETLHQNIHLNTNFTKLRELYALWGGIPRYVVEKVDIESFQNLLEMALNAADFDKIIRSSHSPPNGWPTTYSIVSKSYALTKS
ncbi:602_t:CDS:2, partial [Dentiscutata erythropus]